MDRECAVQQRRSERASLDLDREFECGFGGLERNEAERVGDEVAAMEAKSTRPDAGRRLRRIVLEASSGTNQSLPVGAPRDPARSSPQSGRVASILARGSLTACVISAG
jgi:hypothetical protein